MVSERCVYGLRNTHHADPGVLTKQNSYLRELQRASQQAQQAQQHYQQSARLLSPTSTDAQTPRRESSTNATFGPNSDLDGKPLPDIRPYRINKLMTYIRQVRGDVPASHELSSQQPVDGAFSIWTCPFSAPSVTIKNTQNDRRKWSQFTFVLPQSSICNINVI